MCIAFWTLEHKDYALILCTNRDEYLDRPTEDAHFHSFGHEAESDSRQGSVLSGRDEKAGGTWLGLSRTGRVALLTNITEAATEQNFYSRGHLVSTFLLSDSSHPLEDEVDKIIPRDVQFAGFNLLLLAPGPQTDRGLSYEATLVTNHGAGGAITSRFISSQERQFGALSNGIDGQGGNEWPKVQHGVLLFRHLIQTLSLDCEEAELTDRLFQLLDWRPPEPVVARSQLRNTIHVMPIPISVEGSTSGTHPNVYGTRLSTVLLIRRDGKVLFIERDIWKLVDGRVTKSEPPSERIFRFQLEGML